MFRGPAPPEERVRARGAGSYALGSRRVGVTGGAPLTSPPVVVYEAPTGDAEGGSRAKGRVPPVADDVSLNTGRSSQGWRTGRQGVCYLAAPASSSSARPLR
eukprot:169768-Prorocentrum_minimum.AAC.1